jgi:D-alanyl-D-alanine carboxypeptidase
MMRPFARRKDSGPSSGTRIGSDSPRTTDRPGQRARWRARPAVEALDPRLLLTTSAVGTADATASAAVSNEVAQVLAPYLAQNEFPGISVAVVTDGQVALAQGYGVSNVANGAPAEANTRFDIGSVTKTFTALGVLMLYQESQGTSHPLNLNAPISDYLHNTKSFKLPRKWDNLTTMELLNMTTGILDASPNAPWQSQVAASAKARFLYTPGTESSYSNTNYNLLGELIEQWTGESYATFLQNQIFQPLGMSQTQELGHSATVSNQAVGYDEFRNGRWPKAALQNGSELYAAAGMVSTAQDMATYMTALLSGRLLDPATYALMWTSTPTPQFGSNPASDALRGLGWDTAIDSSAGPIEVTKNGSIPGFTSQIILDPSTDSGVFISFNANYAHGSTSSPNLALQVAKAVYQATQNGSLP